MKDGDLHLLHGVRLRQQLVMREVMDRAVEHPRVAERRASDHDAVAAGFGDHALGVLRGVDVAVADDRNAHRFLGLPNVAPVGMARIQLLPGASMHADGFASGAFDGAGVFDHEDMVAVPADPHLDRYRLVDGVDDRADHLVDLVGIEQPAGAGIAFGHLRHRTAHVDVDDVRIRLLVDDFRSLDKGSAVSAENLQAERLFALIHEQHFARALVAVDNRLVAHHLRANEPGAELFGDEPECRVADARHRSENDIILHFDISDFKHNRSFLLSQTAARHGRQFFIVDAESVGDPPEKLGFGLARAALERTEHRNGYFQLVGQLLLGEALQLPKGADPLRQLIVFH
ncbi:hypothetical protein BN871_AB_00920 [Paenibacillus sp. P22]|nr:hypothetical protein BN871_AB_00920 [Paenibacillus sp. P22]